MAQQSSKTNAKGKQFPILESKGKCKARQTCKKKGQRERKQLNSVFEFAKSNFRQLMLITELSALS